MLAMFCHLDWLQSPPARGARIETTSTMLCVMRWDVAPRAGGED